MTAQPFENKTYVRTQFGTKLVGCRQLPAGWRLIYPHDDEPNNSAVINAEGRTMLKVPADLTLDVVDMFSAFAAALR